MEKKSKKLRNIAIILLVIGLLLVGFTGVYMLMNRPSGDLVDVDKLPEPGILPMAIDVSTDINDNPSGGVLDKIGVIKIPAMGISENIVEGSGNELLYGVGHVIGSADLGQTGNCVLAGHRNYIQMHPFRYMDTLKVDDLVYVQTDEYEYTYKIYEILTVGAEDDWVLKAQGNDIAMITLVTCTPVLNPVNRLIAWGELVETNPI